MQRKKSLTRLHKKGRFPWKSYHVTRQVSPSVFQIGDGDHQHSNIEKSNKELKNKATQNYNSRESKHEWSKVKTET